MKGKLLERLTRAFAPPARLLASFLAILATATALATDSLEETGGVLSAVGTDTLAFKNATLSDLTAETLHGRMSGDWAGTAATESFTFNNFDRSNEGSEDGDYITCQAQLENDGYLKGMVLKFTQSSDDINVQIVSAGAVNGGSIGGSVAGQTGSNGHYAIYNLFLTRTWSDSAVVLWEAGQFGVTSKTGSDGNTYTLSLNGNASDGSTITIDQSVGATVDFGTVMSGGMTVLFRYTDLPLDTTKRMVVSQTSSSQNNRTGIWINTDSTAGKTGGVWNGGDYNTSVQTRATVAASQASGVFAFTYKYDGGSYFYYLCNGVRTTLHANSTLKAGGDTSISGCAIGGPRVNEVGAATGMKITGIAIFNGVLTESQMTSFVWPSAIDYQKWSYINSARRMTWTTPSTATGDNLPAAGAAYTVFDMNSGLETANTATGGGTSSSAAYWHYLCYSSGVTDSYAAPGTFLRFTAGDYAAALGGSFSPLTVGGMIVEEGATGYSFAQQGSRYTVLGDPTGATETYFDFNESFTIARNSGCHLDGTINITVASGKTLTIAGTTTKCTTTAKATSLSGTAGGTLKLHGKGHLAATLTASDATLDYTDLSTTVSSSSDAYIQGTLTVNSGTVIALPADATFPYYIATGISGSLNIATGVTIGGAAAPYYQANAEGYIEYVAPSEVTISSDATWGSGDLTGWATDDLTKDYIINVTADATLTLPSAVSSKTIKFNVDDGVTLTVSGSALTAADEIEVTGAGVVKAGAANTFNGTIVGDGTLVYDNLTPSGATFTNDAWEGVLWFKNGTRTSMDASALAGANSTLRLTGVTGYFNYGKTSTGALDLQDDGETKAFTLSDGWSDYNPTVFAKLTGSGTLAASNTGVSHRYVFKDPSAFSGTIDMSGKVFRIILGDNTSLSPAKDGTITVVSGATVNIAAGKTWTSDGGIEVDGTLNLGAGATAPKLKSGSDGMVVVASGTATVAGIDSSAISPTLGIVGKLAFADTTTTELTLTAEKLSNYGTLDLSGCTAVTTMNLAFGNTRSGYLFGTITPPPNLATVNVTVTEVLSEDGAASLTIPDSLTGVSILNVTVTGLDGTTKTVTTNVSGSVLSVSYTPTVSGAACWCAYEMEYESGVATGFENSGSDTTALTDDGVTGSDAFTDDGMLYTYAHPWRDMTGDNAYPSSWTAVVRCTVPAYENAAVITFGTKSGGLIGLVAGADPETQMKLVKTTGDSAFTTLATMTVQNATTAQHVYVFSVENNQTIKVYCDGEQVLNETYSAFTLGGGIQVGSVHGGVGSTGIVRFGKGESPANTLSETVQKAARIDCVRLYKTVLGPNAIAQLSVEFPAVKLYRATVGENATTTWDALTWSPTWDGGNEYSKIILTTEGDATLTLPDSITADEFTINVASDSTLTLAKAAGGTSMTVSKLEIDDGTVAVADANFFGSHAINGTGTLKITTTGALTSAISGNAKVEIPSGVAVGVTTGSIANTITGAGTLAYLNALPATSPSFSGWTGTVQLPAIATDVAINFNNYGIAGSTVAITSMTAGWIANAEVLPEINLVGNMTLNHFSGNWVNTFDKLSGAGTFTLAADGTADGYVDNYFLVKDVSDFTGSISVVAPGLAIGAAKPESPTTYGQIYLTTSATIASGKTWTATSGIVLGAIGATLTNADGDLATAPTSGVENYKVVSAAGEDGTEYSLAVDGVIVDVEDGIIVTSDWLTDNGLSNATAQDLSAARPAGANSNGYSYYACYALGLDPTEPTDTPLVSVSVDGSGNFVVSVTDKDGNELNTAANVTVTPTFYKYNPATGEFDETAEVASTVSPAAVVGESNVGYIRAKITITAR